MRCMHQCIDHLKYSWWYTAARSACRSSEHSDTQWRTLGLPHVGYLCCGSCVGAPADELLSATQNAECVVSGEEYYRRQYTGDHVGWNTRDQHMTATVLRIIEHFKTPHPLSSGTAPRPSKHGNGIIIWAHNSHVGDCRATEPGGRGEWNLGQMLRQTLGQDAVYNIGFGTHAGTVTAAPKWGGACQKYTLSTPLEASHDEVCGCPTFHDPESQR